MGIQINGATDSITAIDGTIDVVSAIGNAGVVTATAFVGNITGNVTGNINHASNLELQVGGVTRANINSSGQLTATGKVFLENNLGIRNTSASVPLHVKAPDTSGGNIAYFDDTGSGTTGRLMVLTTDGVASGGIKFQTVNKRFTYFGNATNKITIDNNNSKIGINTDAPSKELHVDGTIFASGNTSSLNGGLRIQPNNDGTNYGGVIYGGAHNDNNHAIYMRRGADGGNNTIDINSYGMFRVFTNGALASQDERLRINSDGDVLINTSTTPTADIKLLVSGNGGVSSGSYFSFRADYGNVPEPAAYAIKYDSSLTNLSGAGGLHQYAYGGIAFNLGGQDRVNFKTTGEVGIGTDNPSGLTHWVAPGDMNLYLKSKNATGTIRWNYEDSAGTARANHAFVNYGNGKSDFFTWATHDGSSLAERVRITKEGAVGIGSDNPHRKLVVGNNSDMAVIGGNAGIYLGTHSTGGFQNNAGIARAAANNYHISGSVAGDLCIASESGQSMIFGVSHGAGAMDTFLHVSRLRNLNFYGADYKFHLGSNEKLNIKSNGEIQLTDSTIRYENTGGGFNQVKHLSFPIYFSSGTTHTVLTIGGSLDSGFVCFAVLEYIGLYDYSGNDMSGGVRRAFTRRTNNNTAWRDFDDQVSENIGENRRPDIEWDSGVLKVTTPGSTQITGYITVTAHANNMSNFTLTRN